MKINPYKSNTLRKLGKNQFRDFCNKSCEYRMEDRQPQKRRGGYGARNRRFRRDFENGTLRPVVHQAFVPLEGVRSDSSFTTVIGEGGEGGSVSSSFAGSRSVNWR